MATSTLKNTILSVTRRTKNGFTVGEIFERVYAHFVKAGTTPPPYSSVRGRVYELAKAGTLYAVSTRRDPATGRNAFSFRRTTTTSGS